VELCGAVLHQQTEEVEADDGILLLGERQQVPVKYKKATRE
jgi:hypothetical protein